jgi:hypothetical protein
MKGAVSQLILNINPDALSKQELDHVHLPKVCGNMKRSITCLGFSIAVSSTVNLKTKV